MKTTKSDYLTPELREFLKKKGALRKFLSNLDSQFSNDHICMDFGAAFIWADTPEGCEFWSELDDEFENTRL